jgi:hypothetical protein
MVQKVKHEEIGCIACHRTGHKQTELVQDECEGGGSKKQKVSQRAGWYQTKYNRKITPYIQFVKG